MTRRELQEYIAELLAFHDKQKETISELDAEIIILKNRNAELVRALHKHACKCTDRCAVFEHLPADNGTCLARATASLLDVHAPGWRNAI
jgi:hypothetical protein